MKLRKTSMVGVLSVLLLTGCTNDKPEEELYQVFEKSAEQEKSLYKDMKKLKSLEKTEHELYKQVITDGTDNHEAASPKIAEALKNVEERLEIVKNEEKALEKAHEEMSKAQKKIKKIENADLKKKAISVEVAFKDRRNVFDKWAKGYKEIANQEKTLYSKLNTKEMKLKEITEQIKANNQLYAKLKVDSNEFNNLTNNYNENKIDFYKEANIKIKQEN
ncbi:YkyA family protein [Bacillus luti]|nr:YkyA family protein [Bacillus cereus]HDR8331268.1 YkyA family protein [Bacillus cereus]HDR8338125.1 YkyA family protein [Bacillus cereus]